MSLTILLLAAGVALAILGMFFTSASNTIAGIGLLAGLTMVNVTVLQIARYLMKRFG